MKKIISMILVILMIVMTLPTMVFATGDNLITEFFPNGTIDAPGTPYIKLFEDENNDYGDYIDLWITTIPEIREIYTAASKWEDENPDKSETAKNRFNVDFYEFVVQTDAKIDDGDWQYTPEWNSPDFYNIEDTEWFCFSATQNVYGDSYLESFRLSDVDAWSADNGIGFLNDILIAFTDNEGNTDYKYDFTNHTLSVRCRIMLKYQLADGNEIKTIFSDWSPITSIGKNGTQKALTKPSGIEAPVLSDFSISIMQINGVDFPDAKFYIDIPDSVYQGLMYCCAEQGMFEPYMIESQMRVDNGNWISFYVANAVWINDGPRNGSPDIDVNFKSTSVVEVRARILNQLGQVSDWSNIVGNKPTFITSTWAQDEIEQAYELGLIPDCLMDADLTKPITRKEFAAVSVKAYEALSNIKVGNITENPFKDTNDPEVLKAYFVGITTGTSDTTFDPDVLLNREQAATMLTRVYKKIAIKNWEIGKDSEFAETFNDMFTMPTPFADDAKISSWARDSVYFMAANGIINGVGDNTFAPRATTDAESAIGYAQATREQALIIATRMVNNLG